MFGGASRRVFCICMDKYGDEMSIVACPVSIIHNCQLILPEEVRSKGWTTKPFCNINRFICVSGVFVGNRHNIIERVWNNLLVLYIIK